MIFIFSFLPIKSPTEESALWKQGDLQPQADNYEDFISGLRYSAYAM